MWSWGSAVVMLGFAASNTYAEPRLEASGFVGVGHFGSDNQLGDSWAPEQLPGTAPILGGRLHILAVPALASSGDRRLQLGIETELSLAPAFTGSTSTDDTGRMSYFAPVIGWHAHLMLRIVGSRVARPHLVVGGGGETVLSSSPYMRKETDPVFYWGPGISIPVSDRWSVRVDGRHGVIAAIEGMGVTSTFELQFGVAGTFSLPERRIEPPPIEPPPEQPAIDDTDADEDGLPDHLDACPNEPESINGLADDDGCAEADADNDGLTGDADQCPAQTEDFDRHADDDGCPDPDNDGDGIDDGRDTCPGEPETRNSFDDDDGCPDGIPPDLTRALEQAGTIKFGYARARVTEAGATILEPLRALLAQRRELRIAVIGHPDREQNTDLARRRADAVKWHLIDQGIAADRIESSVGDVAPKAGIEIQLLPPR